MDRAAHNLPTGIASQAQLAHRGDFQNPVNVGRTTWKARSVSEPPFPPTPAECDLRGMPYMPLDIVRLFDSDLYILSTGDEFKAAVTLWGKAFLQVPAGSLADDDRILAHLSGSRCWSKVRQMALRGWYKCTDGRLYHHTVAEKVQEAWEARQAQRQRTAAARAARAAARSNSTPSSPVAETVAVNDAGHVTPSAPISVTDVATGSKGREGKGREDKKERTLASLVTPQPASEVPDIPVRDQLWAEGVPIVRALVGKSDAQSRALIGRMLAQNRDDCAKTLARIREGMDLRPVDPIAWLMASVPAPPVNRVLENRARALDMLGLDAQGNDLWADHDAQPDPLRIAH